MRNQAKRKTENRTLTVDFNSEATYHRLCQDGRAFVEFVIAFMMSIGFQLKHKCSCPGGFRLTRHSHYVRVRLGGLTIWRIQGTACRAVFTVLPHFVLRYRKMKPSCAKKVLLATHGGLSLELCAALFKVSPMAVYRLVCALGRTCMVKLLTRCRLPLPVYFIVDEKHSHCLEEKVYLPTIVCGRVIWHLSYTTAKSVEAFFEAYGKFLKAAISCDPPYYAKGILTVCQIFFAQKAKKTENNRSLGQRLRRFIQQVTLIAGKENGQRVKKWLARKKDGWYALFEESEIPKTSALLDQAHNSLARKLFMMKGFHHKEGSQESFLNGIAILYNLVPYQRRAKNAGQCGIQVEGGKLPTDDWLLNLQLLTSGGLV